jgi:hypothetical protein
VSSRPKRDLRPAIGAVAALAALIVLLLVLRGSRDDRPRANEAPAVDDERPPRDRSSPPAIAAAPRPPAQKAITPPRDAPLVPIIDEIVVEKPEVCRGEENLITVKAHTADHREDAYLHTFIASETGASVPLRLHDRSDEARGAVTREVIVFGRDNVATRAPLPPYTIKDCDAERLLTLSARMLPNREGELELAATIRDLAAAEPMAPVRYVWSFGDGATAETDVPVVAHDFGGRPQDTLYSHFVVTCEAFAADGERVVGRKSVQLLNPAFEELTTKQLVRLSTMMTPRFPEVDERGRVTQTVRVWHHRPDAVRLTRLVVVTNYLPDPDSGTRRAPTSEVVDPRRLLGADRVPPAGITATLTLDPVIDGDVFSRDVQIEGVSTEGWTAHGNFSLMRPPPRPTRENSRPVLSKYVEAKILRAIELTGKPYVTDEDIWSLEQQGLMDDLRPEDFPPPEPEPEPDRPPAGRAAPSPPENRPSMR